MYRKPFSSLRENRLAAVADEGSHEVVLGCFLPDESKRMDPHVSPLRATLEQLKGLPPELLIIDENEVLRDKGEAYARKLSEAGIAVVSTRYNGMIHDFAMLNAVAEAPPVRAGIRQANDALRAALHK